MEFPGAKKQFVPPAQSVRYCPAKAGFGAFALNGDPATYACCSAMIAGSAFPISGKLLAPGAPQTAVADALPGLLSAPFAVCSVMGWPGAEHGEKTCRNAPVCWRNGASNNTLFQREFSQNNPIPPRITILPEPPVSQAKPELRCEVCVRLCNLVAEGSDQRSQLRDSRVLTVSPSGISMVSESKGQSQVLPKFPGITEIQEYAVVGA